MRTFIKWQGNKSKHINKFIKYIPEEFERYIEPFVGSGAMFLKLQPTKWIINDINKDLINIWKCIKKNPDEIITNFKEFGIKFKRLSKEDKKDYCKEISNKIDKIPYNTQRACVYLLMILCSYMGFLSKDFKFKSLSNEIINNNFYFNNIKFFNNVTEVHHFLNNSYNGKIYNKDYRLILEKAKKGDFVFLDPPYIEDHDYQFNYNKNENLNDLFLKELLKELKKLDKKGVQWLMTQADTKDVKIIFKEFTIKKFKVYRAASKCYINELVIMNY